MMTFLFYAADNFIVGTDNPRQPSEVSPTYEPPLVCQLATSLPLLTVADVIADDTTYGNDYWRRRCEVTWSNYRTMDHQVGLEATPGGQNPISP